MLLNCDLGEWESREETREMMGLIDAANVACGGHAGDGESMRFCVEVARELGVLVGAHPGVTGERGRGGEIPSVEGFEELLRRQVEELLEISGGVHHVKLHGMLYHAVEREAGLAEVFCERLREWETGVFCLAGGDFSKMAREAGVRVFEEGFADRGYLADGSLVPRGNEGAIVSDLEEVAERVRRWKKEGAVETVCVHSDSAGAVGMLKGVREVLNEGGSGGEGRN